MQYTFSIQVDDITAQQLGLPNSNINKAVETAIHLVLLNAMSARLNACWSPEITMNGHIDAGSFDPAPAAPVPSDAVQQHLAANKLDDKDLFRGR